jgi:uncharacterized OsmC-like protein
MVNFDADFRKRMMDRMERFSKFDKVGTVKGTVSVSVIKGDNLHSEAMPDNQNFSWASDENGPSPLAYFISSLAMCQCIHYGEHAGSMDLKIKELEIKVNGEFRISRPRTFERILYTVIITSPESEETVIQLAKESSSDCYITNTMSKACEVQGRLVHNGKDIGLIDTYA